MTRYATLVLLGTFILVALGCRPEAEPEEPAEPVAEAPVPSHPAPAAGPMDAAATAHLAPADPASGISGTVRFEQEMGGVRVMAEVSGLPPGKHGLHIHEGGECTPPFDSAGGHLDPFQIDHGCPPEPIRHLGDLGNIEVGADGTGSFDQVIDKISLVDPHHQVAQRAVIVHAAPDDCRTQPTGASQGRLACGVIRLASPPSGQGGQMAHQPPSDEPPGAH